MEAWKAVEMRGVVAGYFVARGFRSIFKKFQPVLRGISLDIGVGERVAVIGESGAGKTTLIKVLLGLLRPVRGAVRVLGMDPFAEGRKRLEYVRMIGYVPQDPGRSLNPRLRIRKILMEPLEALGVGGEEGEERILEALQYVHLHPGILDYYPDQLSGGMMQRILIARALVHKPRILILDEPTSALDVSIQAQIINILNEIYEELRPTMITVTHDIPVAQYLADRAIILYEGRIVEDNRIDEIIMNPKHPYTKTLIKAYMVEL